MTEALFILIGLIVGFTIGFLLSRNKATANEAIITTLKSEHEARIADIKNDNEKNLTQVKLDAAELRRKELDDLQRSYDTQLSQFKEHLSATTEKILKERSGELQQANTQKMDEILRPLKENLARMEMDLKNNRETSISNVAKIESTIEKVVNSTTNLSAQAERLSTALQRKNKISGNWGELILSQLLESQGLKEHVHYDVQNTMKDELGNSILNEESGSRMIPDVILHLTNNRDIIIDSKMSLTAFIDYQNAETEEERQIHLAKHLDSIKSHIKELKVKDYSKYITKPHTSPDFVIMFVPIEAALQLALSAEPSLFQDAFNKRVLLTSGQTLIAALHIIDLSWVAVMQERNIEQIMDEARKLIDHVNAFYTEYAKLGKQLHDATETYNTVAKRVTDDSRSILATGRRLEQLGARGKKELPNMQ